jgi:hypothetical protein
VSYNASAEKITTPRVAYVVSFENKNLSFYLEKRLLKACKFISPRIGSS